MKKLLFTGGKGFFCTALAETLAGRYDILATDKNELDIVDSTAVNKVFREFRPDIVLHAAAIAVTQFCNEHPELAHAINVDGAVNVARACADTGAKLIFISSEQVFNGNPEPGPYTEEHMPQPDTVYGQNKLEAERMLADILPELWVLRFTWQFGLPHRGRAMAANILWDTVRSVLRGEVIHAPVHEYRGMTYVEETVHNLEKIFQIPYGTYHVGSENAMNRYEIVKLIFAELGIAGRSSELLTADEEKYRAHPRDVRLHTGKLSSCGIRFGVTADGIRQCIRDYGYHL